MKLLIVTESKNGITISFLSSSGYDVDIDLKKKDANNLRGTVMGMYYVKGERIE